GQDLNGDIAIEFGVGSAVNGAHTAFAELRDDLVVSDRLLRAHRAISGIVSLSGRITRHPETERRISPGIERARVEFDAAGARSWGSWRREPLPVSTRIGPDQLCRITSGWAQEYRPESDTIPEIADERAAYHRSLPHSFQARRGRYGRGLAGH